MNKETSILKWVGIALACLSTVFTLVIVGSHLSGRLVGLGKIGIIGTVGAELMCIICAWLAMSKLKKVAGVAMLCQIILTAVLLINASIALDLDWQENQASKAEQAKLDREKLAAEEQRKTIQTQAELAAQLADKDKRLAREFVRSGNAAVKLPTVTPSTEPEKAPTHINVADLSVYERYGLTVVPLFLGLLTVVALGLAAHSDSDAPQAESSGSNSRQTIDMSNSQPRQYFAPRPPAPVTGEKPLSRSGQAVVNRIRSQSDEGK